MASPHYQARVGEIASLADVYCYQTTASNANADADADAVGPPTTRRKSFPRALKRLRDRLRVLDERLALDVNALRQDVLNLELQKTLLLKKLRDQDARERATAVATISEYFQVFQSGWLLPADQGAAAGDETQLLVARQRRFLASSVDPNVVGDLVSHWQALSRSADAPRLALESVECMGDTDLRIVSATGTLTALERDHTTRTSELRQVRYPCRVMCVVTAAGIIARHDFELDGVLGLLNTVGTLEHVARWLHAAPLKRQSSSISLSSSSHS